MKKVFSSFGVLMAFVFPFAAPVLAGEPVPSIAAPPEAVAVATPAYGVIQDKMRSYITTGTDRLYDWHFIAGPTQGDDASKNLKLTTRGPNGAIALACHGASGAEEMVIGLAGVQFPEGSVHDMDVTIMGHKRTYPVTVTGNVGTQMRSILRFSGRDAFRILTDLSAIPMSFDGAADQIRFSIHDRTLPLHVPGNADLLRTTATVCARWHNRVLTGDELTPLERQALSFPSHGLHQPAQ